MNRLGIFFYFVGGRGREEDEIILEETLLRSGLFGDQGRLWKMQRWRLFQRRMQETEMLETSYSIVFSGALSESKCLTNYYSIV